MRSDLHVSHARFVPAPDRRGVRLGWIRFRLGKLRINSASLEFRDGRYRLRYLGRRATTGRAHPFLEPVDKETRRAIENEVLRQLGIANEVAS
jgi:hypothetical protein